MRSPLQSLLLIFVFSAGSISCQANLGDTLKQCIARCGKPFSHGQGDSTNGGYAWYAFNEGIYKTEESFDGGVVVMEVVWKADETAFSESEQDAVLQKNSNNGKWIHKKDASWLRDDGAIASYSSSSKWMILGLGSSVRKY